MRKSSFFLAVFVASLLLSTLSYSQSKSQVDPGISTHNYKHPNKAAQAKKDANVIRVSNISTIERYGKLRGNRYTSSTPKYAVRPAGLVISRTYSKEKVALNPLTSDRNYKTPSALDSAPISELASEGLSNDSIYPNQD